MPGRNRSGTTGAEPKQTNLGCNLYVSHAGEPPTFIATLAEADRRDWEEVEAEKPGPEVNTAAISPSGTLLAFPSARGLTGYDNEQARTGECEAKLGNKWRENGSCRELFIYDADNRGAVCASLTRPAPVPSEPRGSARLNKGSNRALRLPATKSVERWRVVLQQHRQTGAECEPRPRECL